MAKRAITIQLEPELIEAIDTARGTTARQEWIATACRQFLLAGRLGAAVKHYEPDLRELAAEGHTESPNTEVNIRGNRIVPPRHLSGCKCPVCK